tara:strand:- start:242 stop:1015 length:774 start_codon:yes stop_codon:yes gene_type:complete
MINKNLISNYKKTGFIIIKDFFNKKNITKTKKKILLNTKKKTNKLFFYEPDIKKIRRIENICEFSDDAKKLIHNKNLKKIIYQILGHNTLFKDKLNFKYPKARGFEPHIDGHFFWKNENNKIKRGWKEYSDKFLNVVIPLENTNKINGCLQIAKKNETFQILGTKWNDITKKTYRFTPKIKKKFIKKFNFVNVELKIGDILIFDWRICHRSKKNLSKNSRMIFYATFAKNKKKINLKKIYYQDKINSKNSIKNKSLN